MYAKKFVFTGFTLPALVFMHQAAEYQQRKAAQKRGEEERRGEVLKSDPVDITPQNKGSFPWAGKNADSFEQEWSMKPVEVKGVFDHSREIHVQKTHRGEKGVQIITPFYTHLDKDGKPSGIMVNRGWVPADLKTQRLHYMNNTVGSIQGVLYRGDKRTKYTTVNAPIMNEYRSAHPEELSLVCQLPNSEEASQFMLHMVDFDEEVRQVLPTVPTKGELTKWPISVDRH